MLYAPCSMQLMNIVIFGPQGCGKGTQAELLVKKYNLAHIETGQIFREIANEKSELGEKIKDITQVKKELVPDELTVEVIKHYVEKVSADKGVILDSAPRSFGQIELVEKMFESLGRKLDRAIYISLPYEESVARITKRYVCTNCRKTLVMGVSIHDNKDKCPFCEGQIMQRADDTPEGISKRLKIFYETTMPVVEHYRKKEMLIEVDGNQGIENVFEDIIGKLK